jgi:hypothetical protein
MMQPHPSDRHRLGAAFLRGLVIGLAFGSLAAAVFVAVW